MLEVKIQSKKDPNLTTLFLPNGDLRVKPDLKLPLFVLNSPQEASKESNL